MSDWRTTELFIERSNAQHSAYAVGVAIAALGNRKEDGWMHASLDRIALLARLDRQTANLAIRALVELGEVDYEPGRSRFHPSRYRIRVEVLRDRGIDRFRCPLTMGQIPTVEVVDHGEIPHGDHGENPYADHGEIQPSPWGNSTRDHGEIQSSPWGKPTRSIDTESVNRSIDQISDQSARDGARKDDASKDAGVEQREDHPVALKTALEECQRAAHGSAGEADGGSVPTSNAQESTDAA